LDGYAEAIAIVENSLGQNIVTGSLEIKVMAIEAGEMGISPDAARRLAAILRAFPVARLALAKITVLLDLLTVIVAFAGMMTGTVGGLDAGQAGGIIDIALHANASGKTVRRIGHILVHVLARFWLLGSTFGELGEGLFRALCAQFR